MEPSKKGKAKNLAKREGQNFSKSKKFKILNEDKKNYNKAKNTVCQNKQKITTLVYFLAFEGHLSQRNQQTNEQSIFLLKSDYFVIIFLILIQNVEIFGF